MMFDFDLRPLFWLAIFGFVCVVLLVLSGAAWLIGFAIQHVRLV